MPDLIAGIWVLQGNLDSDNAGTLDSGLCLPVCASHHTHSWGPAQVGLCSSGHWKTFTAITCDISTVNQIINFNWQSPSVAVGKVAWSSVWENKSRGVPRPNPQRRWHGSAHVGPALHRQHSWDSLQPSQKELFASGVSKEKENKPAQRRRCR